MKGKRCWIGKVFVVWLWLLLFGTGSSTIAAEAVALVTDVEGNIERVYGDKKISLSILDEIRSGEQLHLKSGTRAVVAYFKSGQTYQLIGPAVINMESGEPSAISGERPVAFGKALASSTKEIRIKPVKVTQAAYVMRGIRLSDKPSSNPVSQEEIEKLRPPADATVPDRVVFATWLEQIGEKEEARKYWKSVASERPNDARLRSKAGD